MSRGPGVTPARVFRFRVPVEMYPRALTAPVQYQDACRPNCGVVLFWTKGPRIGQSRGWGARRIAERFRTTMTDILGFPGSQTYWRDRIHSY